MGLQWNQIIVGHPQTLCHCISISCKQDSILDQSVGGWVSVYIFPSVACRIPSCTKDAKIVGVMAFCIYQLNFSMLNGLCGCCLQQWCLAVGLCTVTDSHGNNLGVWGGQLWPTTQLYITIPSTRRSIRWSSCSSVCHIICWFHLDHFLWIYLF